MKNHLIITLLLCLVIFGTAFLRSREQLVSEAHYMLKPVNDRLTIGAVDEGGPESLEGTPAWAAPFLFLKVPVNKADHALLQTIPGIGPSTAERIISYREEVGSFENGKSMLGIPGIGPKKLLIIEGSITYE